MTTMKKRMPKSIHIALMMCLLLSACGEFAYKRGASRNDLENAKSMCATQGGSQASIEKCMEDNGWLVQQLNQGDPEIDPIMEPSVTTDNRGPDTAARSNKLRASSLEEKSTTSHEPASGNEKHVLPVQTQIKKQADPMDTFKVSSWWKIGSGADSLKLAINECVSILGEKHRPDDKTQIATRGLLVCMNGKGWRGLRAK